MLVTTTCCDLSANRVDSLIMDCAFRRNKDFPNGVTLFVFSHVTFRLCHVSGQQNKKRIEQNNFPQLVHGDK